MTTGRINQVTTLSRWAGAYTPTQRCTPKGRIVHSVAIDAIASASQQRATPGTDAPKAPTTIHLPPQNFPHAGPRHTVGRSSRRATACHLQRARGGYLLPITPRADIGLGLPPNRSDKAWPSAIHIQNPNYARQTS